MTQGAMLVGLVYNEKAVAREGVGFVNVTNFQPTNSPAQSASFGIDVSTVAPGSQRIAQITGTMRLEIVPAVSPLQDLGFQGIPNSQFPNGATFAKNRQLALIDHMWPGGTTCSPFFNLASGFTGKDGIDANYCTTAEDISFTNPRTFQEFPENRSLGKFLSEVPIQKFDQRATKPLGGNNSSFTAAGAADATTTLQLKTAGENSLISPYILFPEDRLVFGFDAGIGMPTISAKMPNFISASFATLKAGNGKLTMFGSLILNSKEYFPTTNQPLITTEIQEALHYDNPVLDEYQIDGYEEFSGSNQEQTVAGGYGINAWDERFDGGNSGDRRVIGTRNRGTLGTTGSLQRFDILDSQDEIFKDSGKPNTAVFRYDKFGNIRDMLEPLRDSRFVKLRTTNKGLRDAPVFVRFFRDGEETSPSNTFSQNLSTYVTNSIVYIDNPASTLEKPKIGQDRPTNPDVALHEYLEIE